jgi:cytochrome c-type biogenesis protein CcmH/NrfG
LDYEWVYCNKNAVPKEQAQATARFFMNLRENPNDISTWYTPPRAEMQMKELANTGMVGL